MAYEVRVGSRYMVGRVVHRWPMKYCSPVAAHIKGADELLICAMPAARNVNIIHSLFALQPML